MKGIGCLLRQVLEVHHRGRPDLFRTGVSKYTEPELAAILADDSRPVFVAVGGEAEEEPRVLGYAFCIFEEPKDSHILTDVRTLYVDDICVDESARGQHIGKSLYEYVISFAKAQGFYHVTLNVWSCNPGAVRFYESLGMKPYKIGMETIL